MWTALTNCNSARSESHLQAIFDQWNDATCGTQIAGAPKWLLDCRGPNQRRSFQAESYSRYRFTPDVFWDNPTLVVLELKHGAKYQPLALAEVLHHAWKLGDPKVLGGKSEGHPLPVIVSSSNDTGWLRAALCYLFTHGLRKDALKYLESTFYERPDGGEYLWIEEPFADWLPDTTLPKSVPLKWQGHKPHCYRIAGCESWVLTVKEKIPMRPEIPDEFILISSTSRPGEQLAYLHTGRDSGTYLVSDVGLGGSADEGAPQWPF